MTTGNCDQRHFVRLRVYSDTVAAKNSDKYLVLEESRLWSNQMDIIYSFVDDESEDSLDLYKKKAFLTTAMNEYTKYANVKFFLAEKQDKNAAHIRCSFESGTEHGTMVGTDALMVNSGPTVNLGGMDLGRDDKSNFAMALHAIGHVLGLLHEVKDKSTNFGRYDGFSVMAYSGEVSDRIELSDSDKAWLTLNYPRAPFNTPVGPKDIWTPHRSLRVLEVDPTHSAKILKADDIMARRLIYCQFLASGRKISGEVNGLDKVKDLLGIYPVAIPGDKGDVLQKLQVQTRPTIVPGRMSDEETPHPVEIEQYAYSLFRALGISLDPSASNQTSKSKLSQYVDMLGRIQALLEEAELLEFRSDEELPPEEMLTRAELDELMAQLPGVLNQVSSLPLNGPDIVFPTDVQHGPIYWIRWRAVRKILRWFSRMVSRTHHDVRLLPPQINQTMLDSLEKNTAQNVFQEIYHLCFASTLVHDLNGTQADLQAKHQEFLDGLLPEISDMDSSWKLKWGPVVWKEKPDDITGGPDLAWYVAYNPLVSPLDNASEHPTYVIAIAGTQMRSIYTWLHSNLHVTSVADFDSWVANGFEPTTVKVSPNKPYIAMGTARTVGRLLTEPAPPGSVSAGQTLLQFLKSASQSKVTRFIITGHSLGAALTPALAVALDQASIIPRDRILTYPIAGPSPGNHVFATRFSDNFPAKRVNDDTQAGYKVWNLNLVNEYDPVPHAWSFSKLQTLLKMFPGFHLKLSIRVIVYWIFDDLVRAGVQYAPIQSQRFSSSVDGVLEQHSGAYHELVGITPPALRNVLT